MPIDDLQQAAQKIAGFLATLNKLGGMRLKYRISAARRPARPRRSKLPLSASSWAGPTCRWSRSTTANCCWLWRPSPRRFCVLTSARADLVSFDADNFKALRAQELRMTAETAAEKVLRSGVPYAFPPMNSRERRLLHMAFRGHRRR